MQVTKAIIPCAGFGTRFLPVTKVIPKELLPIVDTPALLYIIDEAVKSGIHDILIVLSPKKRMIKRLFMPNVALNKALLMAKKDIEFALANKKIDAKISFAVQRKMTGSADAVLVAKKFCNNEPFAVLFGDDVMYSDTPVTRQLMDAFDKVGVSVVGCQLTSEEIARRCGVMLIKEKIDERICKIDGIDEKPQGELASNLTSLGRFVLTPDIFDCIKHTKKTNGEVYLTDAISLLAREGEGVCACTFEGRRYDIGNKQGYLEATVEFALRDDKLKDEFCKYLDTVIKD